MRGGPPAVFPSVEALACALVAPFEAAAGAAIDAHGSFTFVATGGSAPSALYPALAGARIPWDRVHVWYGDERCVPLDDPDSNHRAVHAALGATGAHFHPVDTSLLPEDAARAYQAALPSRLDLVHVGMGPDGHVCSLFPGHPAVEETARTVTWIADSPKPPPRRVTLTLPAVAAATEVWFLVTGGAKAGEVRRALLDGAATTPAARLHRLTAAPRWFLDSAAAQLVSGFTPVP